MSNSKKVRPRCADCGDDQDLSYITWEGRTLCAPCFAKAGREYAESSPFLLASEMRLDIIRVPESEDHHV